MEQFKDNKENVKYNESIIRMFLNEDRFVKCEKLYFGYYEVIYIDKYLSKLNSVELYNKLLYIIDNIDLQEKLLYKIIELNYYSIIKRIETNEFKK